MNNNITIKNIILGKDKPKICIPLALKNIDALENKKEELSSLNFDAIELRIDYLENIDKKEVLVSYLEKAKELFGDKIVIFTLRTKNEGGNIEISPIEYRNINQTAIESKCIDIIDFQVMLDENIVKSLVENSHKNKVYTILSYHNFCETPLRENLKEILNLMEEYRGDIKKLALTPNDYDDVLEVLSLSPWAKENYSSPIIFISMGKLGVLSRILGEFFGSCLTFGTMGKSSSLGQIYVNDLETILNKLHKII